MNAEFAPGWQLEVEESAVPHWIATCGDVVIVFAYEASHDDTRHVYNGARAFEKLLQRFGKPVKLLFVVTSHGKPPSERVRKAFTTVGRRLEGHAASTAIVVVGTGFVAALHRGAVSGMLALMRPKMPYSISGTVRDGLAFLLGPKLEEMPGLLAVCEKRAAGPDSTVL